MSLFANTFSETRPSSSFDYKNPQFSNLLLTLQYDFLPWEYISTFVFFKTTNVTADTRTSVGSSVDGSLSLATTNFGLGVGYSF